MRIAYRLNAGIATDIRFVAADYAAQAGESVVDGSTLPAPDSLSTAGALAARAAEQEAQVTRALIEQAERQSLRSLRELVLSLVDPAAIDAATVTAATAELRAAETTARAERGKLQPKT